MLVIKKIPNYKKISLWLITVSIIIVTTILTVNSKQIDKNQSQDASQVSYDTNYNALKINFLSDMMGFKASREFKTKDLKIINYIDSTLKASLTPSKEDDLNNNNINQYSIEFNNSGGYSCKLYYDTLYDKAYIERDGSLYSIDTDFARYIDSLLENTKIISNIDNDVVSLFESYGWTLDYKIDEMKSKINDINALSSFDPNSYYFAYNNELSKDIGLDMSEYSEMSDIDVEIYRIHESLPEEFYPIQECRGIVVKNHKKIIGAFISAGRHSSSNACSLKSNNFEKATGLTVDKWFSQMIKADKTEEKLSKLEPEQVISEYFMALDRKDAKTARTFISKKTLLENLTSNIGNNQLYNERIGLPLTDQEIEAKSDIDNLKSAKLLKTELSNVNDADTKSFKVIVDLQYKKELTINNGEQHWDCQMIYESPQTGWKIEGFGH